MGVSLFSVTVSEQSLRSPAVTATVPAREAAHVETKEFADSCCGHRRAAAE